MKLRLMLPAAICFSFSALAFGQASQTATQSSAEKAFDKVKSPAGNGDGPLTADGVWRSEGYGVSFRFGDRF
jgi:hypothetical protein